MANNTVNTLESIANKADSVMRASRQTQEVNPDFFFMSTYDWVKKAEMQEPAWGKTRGDWVDNRLRDEWLSMMVQQEPHLASVLSTSVTLDANRRYRLVGGRNQVIRYSKIFKGFENGQGFRTLQELGAKDYYNADIGAVMEVETEGQNGALRSIYHVDPTKVRLGKKRLIKFENDIWKPEWYYRLSSQKNTMDKYNRLGFCAVSRSLKLAQTMIALVTHNIEKLGYLAPNGILFISAEDITQDMWDDAMAQRKAVYINNTGNEYYDQLMTIVDRNVKGELVPFSEMPEKFDTFMFTDYMLKGYALAFNRDVRTFWSLNSGNFGGGTEAALQDEKATYAGAAEYILASQEQLQDLLPPSLIFEYEVEDTRGKLQKAEVEKVIIDSAKTLFDLGLEQEKVYSWLADRGVIPQEWSMTDEDVVAEMGILKERWLETEQVQRCIDRFPDEPIIMYQSPGDGKRETITKLWNSGKEAIGRSWLMDANWFDGRRVSRTQAIKKDIDFSDYPYIPKDELTQYKKQQIDMGDSQIVRLADYLERRNKVGILHARQATIEDYNGDLERGDYMFIAGSYNYLEQIEEPDDDENDALALATLMLNNPEEASEENISRLNRLLAIILPASVLAYLLDVRNRSNDAAENAEILYAWRWNARLEQMTQYGILYGGTLERVLTWVVGPTEQHCSDCGPLDGVSKTAQEWIEDGRVPQGTMLECGGWACLCSFIGG